MAHIGAAFLVPPKPGSPEWGCWSMTQLHPSPPHPQHLPHSAGESVSPKAPRGSTYLSRNGLQGGGGVSACGGFSNPAVQDAEAAEDYEVLLLKVTQCGIMLIAPRWLSPKCAQPAHKDVSCFSLISSENLPWILALSSIICFKGSAGQVVTRSLIQECSAHKAPRPPGAGRAPLPSTHIPKRLTLSCCAHLSAAPSGTPQHFGGVCRSCL